jgi:hypothetical protein
MDLGITVTSFWNSVFNFGSEIEMSCVMFTDVFKGMSSVVMSAKSSS